MTVTPAILLLLTVVAAGYLTDWDKPFQFSCPHQRSITFINSYHNNWKEDRRWSFKCSRRRGVRLFRCGWHGEVNDFDQPFLFQCPNNGVIAGISSYHNNHKEDRRFKFKCCRIRSRPYRYMKNCYFADFANDWDKPLNVKLPSRALLKGVFSYHSNFKEDRRFRFEICRR